MYKILCNGIYIHNPAFNDANCIAASPALTEAANCAASLTFTIYPENRGYNSIVPFSSVIEAYDDDELIFRGRPLDSELGMLGQKKFVCESDIAALNDSIVRPYSFSGSVDAYLSMLIDQHNTQMPSDKQFTLRTVTVTDPNDYITRSNSNYPSTMAELQDKLINSFGGYLIVERSGGVNYIDYLAQITNPATQEIKLGRSLLSYVKKSTGNEIATALVPLGARQEDDTRLTVESVNDGSDLIRNEDAILQYGLIIATHTWDDVTVPANLLTKGTAYLSELTGSMQIELSAADLHLTDTSIDRFRCMQNVAVVDPYHGGGTYLVLKKTTHFDKASQNKITVGSTTKGLSGSVRSAERTAEEAEENGFKRAETAIDRSTELITGGNGGYLYIHRDDQTGKPDELIIMDTESVTTAVNVWRFNKNGWGHSSTGYNGTYTMAATINGGIVADFITTGILDANLIRAGSIRSADGRSFVLDIDGNAIHVGEYDEFMNLYNAHFSFAGGALTISNDSSAFAVRISNERLSFLQAGTEIAYMTGHYLYIKDVRVLGNLEQQVPGSDSYVQQYVDTHGRLCAKIIEVI